MKMYNASFETITLRFHLMIAVTVIAFTIGVPVLAFLVVPIAASFVLGISFKKSKPNIKEAKTHKLDTNKELKAKAA